MQAKLYPDYTIVKMPSTLMQDSGHGGKHAAAETLQQGDIGREDSLERKRSMENISENSEDIGRAELADCEPVNAQDSDAVDCCNLLANAPVHGDHYDYHMDADPLTLPDSTWRRIFGDYCNR